MESAGAFPDGDWESSFTKMFSAHDDQDLELTPHHFLGQCSFFPFNNTNVEGTFNFGDHISQVGGVSSTDDHEGLLFHTLDSLNSSLQYLSQESSCYSTSNSGSTGGVFAAQENNYVNYNCSDSYDQYHNIHNDLSMPIFLMGEKNTVNESPCHVLATMCNNIIKEDNNVSGNNDIRVDEEQPDPNVVCGKELQLKRMYDVVLTEDKVNPKKKSRVSRNVSLSIYTNHF